MTEPAIPGYRPGRRLDASGSTEVWEATDPQGRKVALKLYSRALGQAAYAALVQALERASALKHQNLVGILAHGEQDGRIWAAMELVSDAKTLKDLQPPPVWRRRWRWRSRGRRP